MKRSSLVLAAAYFSVLATGCNKHTESLSGKGVPPSLAQKQQMDAQAMDVIRETNRIADQTGLTAFLGGEAGGHTWQEVATYYQGIDQLACRAQVKGFLKQQAIYALVTRYPFLEQASTAEKQYYVDQLLLQPHPDPKLVVAFADNLKLVSAPEQTARLKRQAQESLTSSIARNTSYLTGISARLKGASLSEDEKKHIHSAQEQSERQRVGLLALQQKLVAL